MPSKGQVRMDFFDNRCMRCGRKGDAVVAKQFDAATSWAEILSMSLHIDADQPVCQKCVVKFAKLLLQELTLNPGMLRSGDAP